MYSSKIYLPFFLISDADYIKFLEALEEKEEKQTIDVEKFLEELDLRDKQNQKPVETPLTTFVKQRREDRRVSVPLQNSVSICS